jgi:hypothetical protein
MMDKAGFLDRLGRENVCAHVDAALARAREILGLPPAPPTDPLHEEKMKLDAARQELAGALERASEVLKSPPRNSAGSMCAPTRTTAPDKASARP